MKPKTILLAVITALLVGLSLMVLVVLPGRAREMRPATLPPPPMSEWLTYKDGRFGFSFMYPPDWFLNVVPKDVAGGGVQISSCDLQQPPIKGAIPAECMKIEFMVVGGDPRSSTESLRDWRHRRHDYAPTKVREETEGTTAGRDSLEEKVEWAPGFVSTAIYLPYTDTDYGNTVLFISTGSFREKSMEQTFRDIVSTFKFEE